MQIGDLINKNNTKLYSAVLAEIATSLAYGSRMQGEINRLYEKNKYFYYKLASNSPAYTDYSITMSDIYNDLYSKRALGILLYAEENDDVLAELLAVLKRNYPDIYKFAERGDEKSLTGIYDKLKYAGPSKRKTYENLMFYLIVKLNSENTLSMRTKKYLDQYIDNQRVILMTAFPIKDKTAFLEENKNQIAVIKKRLTKEHGSFKGYEDLYKNEDKTVNDYAHAAAAIFDFEEFSVSRLLSELFLSEKQLNEIIGSYIMVYEDFDSDRSLNFIMSGIVIKALLIKYKECKELFFQNNQETMFFKMHELENKSLAFEQKLFKSEEEKDDYKKRYMNLQNAFDELLENGISQVKKQYANDLSAAGARIKELEEALEKETANRKELNYLRDFMFSLETEAVTIKSQRALTDFKLNKICIIGGTPEWRQRMGNRYKNLFVCLDGFSENLDINALKSADYIFFFFDYMSHAVYYRVIDVTKKHNIPFGYISRTNIELAEAEMVAWIDQHYRA